MYAVQKQLIWSIFLFPQENGHAKTNGNASPTAEAATEDVQVNGKHSADGEVKAEEGGAEKAAPEGDVESSAVANGEDSAKTEENGSAPASAEPAKTKKRFSFKKPFKLSGFSFKKSAKKDAEGGEAAAAAVENGEQKKDAEPEAEEAKPEASSEEAKTEAPTEEPKADEPAESNEEKPSNEVAEEKPTEEKPAEAAPQEPAAAESSDAPAAATE